MRMLPGILEVSLKDKKWNDVFEKSLGEDPGYSGLVSTAV